MRPRILIALCALTFTTITLHARHSDVPVEPAAHVAASITAHYSGPTTDSSAVLARAVAQGMDQLARFYAWAAALPAPRVQHATQARASAVAGTGACGGSLPPCWVMMRESGGNLAAFNPTGCSGRGCYGKWQCDPRTCDGTGSEAEQDAEAARVWDEGRGCSHWNACG